MNLITIVSGQNAATSFTSPGIYYEGSLSCPVQAIFTGSNVVGTIQIEYSLDGVNFVSASASDTYNITASQGLFVGSMAFSTYFRMHWTYTSGTGTITVLAKVIELTGL